MNIGIGDNLYLSGPDTYSTHFQYGMENVLKYTEIIL